ncbi:MAG: putative sulfate exporter family transporter [Deltaproteobacteria bacterium]|nr:MAG: putative sulfate exporter family transporter [Deltaproteobacteria bacterium]RUA00429.1 MAG: putative sulfate exporter family transporter [Deltaproteobacteria bacterium]
MAENQEEYVKPKVENFGWREIYKKEDWWAIWLSLLIIFSAMALYFGGSSLKPLAVTPARWSNFGQLFHDFGTHLHWYILQFIFWAAVFSISTKIMGFKTSEFLLSFIFVYIISVIIFAIGAWDQAHHYNLEPPLVALVIGLIIANFFKLPKWMDTGFRVEYYIKTGIVLLGATLPFTLIIYAGPVAMIQATVIAVTTCLVVYFSATRIFKLDPRLAACLGAGASVCGVSGTIAVAGAVRAKKEFPVIAITLVICWAIVMIFFLPFMGKLMNLHAGIVGAWVGTSEFADAAGFAAAQAYGLMVGMEEIAVRAFTLMKVIGRDIWIGIWAFVFAIISVTKWEKADNLGQKPDAMEIWWRFPKFVLGFFLASAIITIVVHSIPMQEYLKEVKPALVNPIKAMRTWAFIFCFLSIGLTTRFRELTAAGGPALKSFTIGVVVNVILGFIFSVLIFGHYWSTALNVVK